jgi:hypothetical protein
MAGADEAAEQSVAIQVRAEVGDAPASQAIPRVPIRARGGVEVRAQISRIGVDVLAPIGFREEAAEGAVVRQVRKRRELELVEGNVAGLRSTA